MLGLVKLKWTWKMECIPRSTFLHIRHLVVSEKVELEMDIFATWAMGIVGERLLCRGGLGRESNRAEQNCTVSVRTMSIWYEYELEHEHEHEKGVPR